MILLTILFLFVITQWSGSLYLPLAPTIAEFFQPHQQLVVGSLSWFFTGYAIGQLFWGTLSDYIGRYAALIISLSVYCVLEWGIVQAQSPVWFVVLLSLSGFFISANTSIGNALIKDRYGRKTQQVLACVGVAMAGAPVVAPLISSALYAHYDWQSVFMFLSVLGVVLLFAFAVFLKPKSSCNKLEQLVVGSSNRLPEVLKSLCGDASFVWAVTTLAVMFGTFFSLLLVLPFLLTHLAGYDVQDVSRVLFYMSLTYVGGAVFNLFFSRKMSPSKLVRLGLYCIAGVAVIFLLQVWLSDILLSAASLLSMVIALFGIGMLLPAAKAMAMLAREKNVGTVASVMKFTQTIGCVVLTRVAAYAIASNHVMAFLVGLSVLVCFMAVRVVGYLSL